MLYTKILYFSSRRRLRFVVQKNFTFCSWIIKFLLLVSKLWIHSFMHFWLPECRWRTLLRVWVSFHFSFVFRWVNYNFRILCFHSCQKNIRNTYRKYYNFFWILKDANLIFFFSFILYDDFRMWLYMCNFFSFYIHVFCCILA